MKNLTPLLLGGFCLLTFLGREVATSVQLATGPSFSFGGSGRLVSFTVYGPRPGHRIATPLDAESLMWEIELMKDSGLGEMVARVVLPYGKVPEEYVQTFPSSGTAVPLSTRQIYAFFAETINAPGANGFFYMGKDGPILVHVPGLCPSAFVGDVKPIKCGTNEPYVEPTDLEKFVDENRVR